MAPTLTWLDSFEHQQTGIVFYGTNAGIYDFNNRPAGTSIVTGRRSTSHALQLVQNGVTATFIGKVPAASTRVVVDSFYVNIAAAPSSNSIIWQAIATVNGNVLCATDGTIRYQVTTGTPLTTAVQIADGQWHRIDIRFDSSGATYSLDVSVDGVSVGNAATASSTAADMTALRFGSAAGSDTGTWVIADHVRSYTSADYPIGPHQVNALIPNADGTHSWASTNMGPSTGGVASSVTTLWQSVDDWPANTSDYIQYANTTATSSEYAEITFPDVATGSTIWAARAIAAIFSGGTAANAATTRVVDAANATKLNLYVGDQSDTSLRHQATMIPSVTDYTTLNGLKFRVGFPTDSNPAPEWSALMIDYAQPEDVPVPLIVPRYAPPPDRYGR